MLMLMMASTFKSDEMKEKKLGVTFFVQLHTHCCPKFNPSRCLSLRGAANRLQRTIYYTINFYYHSCATVHLFIQRNKATGAWNHKNEICYLLQCACMSMCFGLQAWHAHIHTHTPRIESCPEDKCAVWHLTHWTAQTDF